MRVLVVDFSFRTENDLLPLESAVVNPGTLREINVGETVLLKDADMQVTGRIVRARGVKELLFAKIDWNTVRFLSSTVSKPG